MADTLEGMTRQAICEDALRYRTATKEIEAGEGGVSFTMQVYVVVLEDRHSDPECFVFATAELAVAYARKIVAEYDKGLCRPENLFSSYDPSGKPYVYYRSLSVESDCVWVVEKEVNTCLIS